MRTPRVVKAGMEASPKILIRTAAALVALALLPVAAGAGPGIRDVPLTSVVSPLPLLLGLCAATARLSREAALRDPVLRALKEAVETTRGGATAAEAATLASAQIGQDLDRKAADFHLSQLTRLHILRRHKVGSRRVYLGYDAPSPPPPEPLAARILALVCSCPGVTSAEAAARLGVTDTRFDRHLKPLMQQGLISRWRPQGAPGFLLWPAPSTSEAPMAVRMA